MRRACNQGSASGSWLTSGATTSLPIARNSGAATYVLVAPGSGFYSMTTITMRGSSAGNMPAKVSEYHPSG